MGEQRSHQLLVRLTWTLLLLSVGGQDGSASPGESGRWSDYSFYRSGNWDEDGNFEGGDYDNGDFGDDDVDFEDDDVSLDAEVGDATNFYALGNDGYEVDPMDVTQSPARIIIACSEAGFEATMPNDPKDVKVWDSMSLLSLNAVPEYCGFEVSHNTLTVPFTGCYVTQNDEGYTLNLFYTNELGQPDIASKSCVPSPQLMDSNLRCASGLSVRSGGQSVRSKCPKPEGCTFPKEMRVTCGQIGIPPPKCRDMDCCVDFTTRACYYPMNACTADKHFVFDIRHDSAPIKVDPTKLGVPGYPHCKPVFANATVAVFKFSLTDCGARSYDVGGTKIYLVELQPKIKTLNLKYGVITREYAVRFRIECRYTKTEPSGTQFASTVYTVKKPRGDLPSEVTSSGSYGVILRLAEDETYSSYFPRNHRPLQLLLGQPVYLELNLTSENTDLVVLVNYCLAYPRSAKNALVLVYEGCANPNDPGVGILQVSDLPTNRHQRRFVVKAFQFMEQQTNKYLDEEIYFMCSTEVCQPTEKTCRESCFDRKAP